VCVALGGTLSGEHGIGIEKNEYLPLVFGAAELEAFKLMRRAFDPLGLMNPGKALPAHICGEILGSQKTGSDTITKNVAAEAPPRARSTARAAPPPLEPGAIDHSAPDYVVTVSGVTRLEDLAKSLRAAGQWLPIDPSPAEAPTVGQLVPENAWGPLRTGYGAARDFLLGCRVASPSGAIWSFGGKVVKSATGYDLHRLQVGSRQSLGIASELTFRLRPLPAAAATIAVKVDRWEDGVAKAKRARGLADFPAALFVLGAPEAAARVAVRYEGAVAAVARAVDRALGVLGGELLDARAGDAILAEARDAPYGGASRSPRRPVFSVRLVSRPSRIERSVAAAISTFDGAATRPHLCVHPGVAWADMWCSDANILDADALCESIRRAVARAGGGAVSLRSPWEVPSPAAALSPPALAIMQRLKRGLDPDHRCPDPLPGLTRQEFPAPAPFYPDR
jgi:FAD/FMN-containing dehydrogenase